MRSVLAVVWRLAFVGAALTALAHFAFYLYVWEWARAQIAGTALVALLVVGSALVVLGRIDRLEATAQATASPGWAGQAPPPPAPAPAVEAGAGDRPDFPWLTPSAEPQRYFVFIPVLLTAGLVVSILGALVERLSAAVARPAGRRSGSWMPAAAVTACALGFVGAAIAGMWQWAHFFPTDLGPGTTTMRVEVRSRSAHFEPLPAVESVARTCAMDIGMRVDFASVTQLGRTQVQLTVTPALAASERRRYGGCLEDAHLDRYWLHIDEITVRPLRGPGGTGLRNS